MRPKKNLPTRKMSKILIYYNNPPPEIGDDPDDPFYSVQYIVGNRLNPPCEFSANITMTSLPFASDGATEVDIGETQHTGIVFGIPLKIRYVESGIVKEFISDLRGDPVGTLEVTAQIGKDPLTRPRGLKFAQIGNVEYFCC